MTEMTYFTSAPASRSVPMALMLDPAVVMTSSTTRTLSPVFRGGQRDGSQHDAGDPVCLDALVAHLLGHQPGDEAQDLGVGAGLLDVDVVVALGAGGEGELAELQRAA